MSEHQLKPQAIEEEMTRQPGDILRLSREAAGLSIAEVASRLKLTENKIRALEQGNIKAFAAPVFFAGYLRTYVRLLELSEAEVFAEFGDLIPAQQEAKIGSTFESGDGRGRPVRLDVSNQLSFKDEQQISYAGLLVVVGLVLLGLGYFFWPIAESVPGGTKIAGHSRSDVSAMPARQSIETQTHSIDMSAQETTVPTDGAEAIDLPLPQIGESDGNGFAASAESAAANDDIKATGDTVTSELTLSFTADSWVEVEDARGQRLVYDLGKAGTTRSVIGVAPFNVQLGYVQGVVISYNGAAYDLSRFAGRRSVRLHIGANESHMNNE